MHSARTDALLPTAAEPAQRPGMPGGLAAPLILIAIALGMTCFVTLPPTTAYSQSGDPLKNNQDLQIISTQTSTGLQQLVVVDTRKRTIAVYHIEPAQGRLQLRSVRDISWDLQMEHFNGQSPLPSEIRQVQP